VGKCKNIASGQDEAAGWALNQGNWNDPDMPSYWQKLWVGVDPPLKPKLKPRMSNISC